MKQIVIYNYWYNVRKETRISRQILLQSIETDTRIDNSVNFIRKTQFINFIGDMSI